MHKVSSGFLILLVIHGCGKKAIPIMVQDVTGLHQVDTNHIWLSHEHVLVDFIGADSIQPDTWNHEVIMGEMLPYLEALKAYQVAYFVDATPNYLGRDPLLLKKMADTTGIRILASTGLYGARNHLFIPRDAKEQTAAELAEMWINEFESGIEGTSVKPGFIKIGINNTDPLHPMDEKLVQAAALTHLQTGLTIASHTGKALGLWPQLRILKEAGVSPSAFIWVHSQGENDHDNYLKAAAEGCWISLDGLGYSLKSYVEKLSFARQHGFLNRVLISHDAGWYDPQKDVQSITPFTAIFKDLYPELKSKGFTEEEFDLLMRRNPAKAFGIRVRLDRLKQGE